MASRFLPKNRRNVQEQQALIGHGQFAMQIHDYNHAAEGKLFEASPNEIDQSLKGAIGKSPDSKERLSQSSNPEASGVEPSEEFISKDASLR